MSARTSIASSTTAKIQALLDAANGRRRMRTISYREAVQAIREALGNGYGYVNGGTVANKYGYPASQTKVTAICGNGAVVFSIFEGNANKAGGTGLPWTRAANETKIDQTIDSMTVRPYLPYMPDRSVRMSRNTARRIVAAQDHADALEAVERIPADLRDSDTFVTAADSLAAGNCESETRRVQSWFPGRDAVPAREVLKAIVERAPSLVSFAVRAIRYAQSKVSAA